MEDTISQFIEDLQQPISKMGVKQLRQREETWRALWSWIDEEVKYYVVRAGTTLRVIKRNYQGSTGELGSVKFKTDEIELLVYEKSYNYNDGKYYYENKVIKIPAGNIMMQEFIISSEDATDVDIPEVMSIEELEEIEV